MLVKFNPRPDIEVDFDASSVKEIHETLSSLSDIFLETECGKCQSNDIRPITRVVDDNKFYELLCANCGSTFSFGAHKKGETLFPKKKDDSGNLLPNKGWTKYNPNTGKKE